MKRTSLKRKPLKRKSELKRKTRLRARSKTKKYARRPRDKDFMAFVAKQPCALSFTKKCCGRVQVDHVGVRGLGQKSRDDETIPLCTGHHGERTDYRGHFKGWNGQQMREWCDSFIHYYQRLYRDLVALGQTPWRS